MPMSARSNFSVFKHLLAQRLKGVEKYPIVMMLEPLFACNLECAGCGKIQYPADILHEIVDGMLSRGKTVYLCSNALLLEKHLHRFKPSPRLVLSIHLDGRQAVHDRMVCREGVYKTAIAAIKLAKSKGFRVMSATTIFRGESAPEFRQFFDECMALGVDGMMISPGYAYEKAPLQDIFLSNEQTKAWFREALKDWRKMGWDFNHSPFYLDFLEGKRHYDCAAWGNPLRNIFGWQRPCYWLEEGGYAKTYKELLEATDWAKFGHASGNPKCANCMTHCGFEPSAVAEGFASWSKFIELVVDFATIRGPRKGEPAYARRGKTYDQLVAEYDSRPGKPAEAGKPAA